MSWGREFHLLSYQEASVRLIIRANEKVIHRGEEWREGTGR